MSDNYAFEGVPSLLEHLRSFPEEYVPSREQLTGLVQAHLILSGANIGREEAAMKVVDILYGWYTRFGSSQTIKFVEEFLIKKPRTGDENGSDRKGNGRSKSQHRDLPDGTDVPKGEPARQEERFAPGRGGLYVIERGGHQRDAEGAGDPSFSAGSVHHNESSDGLSKSLVKLELAEHRIDLKVFQKAYSTIHARVLSVQDEARFMKLATWSGTTATLGLLELVIHNIERVVGELEEMLKKIEDGVIPNLDEE